jgi:hypothetical protein
MSTSAEPRSCPVCGKPTKNPKFCSRSCSAQATNREHPRRKPEGSCEKCGTAISTRHRLCPACRQIAAEERAEEKQNIRSFRTLSGQVEKERVDRAYVHQETVFDFGRFSEQPLDPAHPIGDLIQRLLGVLEAKPAYVRPEDVPRFACLLRELREYEAQIYDKGEMVTDRVGNLPIRCLDYIWERWVNHFFEEPFHPLLPTFAVGLAQFVEQHIYGQTRPIWNEIPWRIAPLVRVLDQRREDFGFLRDATFKREFTQRIKGLEVVAKVPPGGDLYDRRKQQVVVKEEEEFSFDVLRGHLTEQGYYDRNDLISRETGKPPIDIASDFHFRGHLLPRGEKQRTAFAPQMGFLPELEIPIRWITHAKVWGGLDREGTLLPVPQWHV